MIRPLRASPHSPRPRGRRLTPSSVRLRSQSSTADETAFVKDCCDPRPPHRRLPHALTGNARCTLRHPRSARLFLGIGIGIELTVEKLFLDHQIGTRPSSCLCVLLS